MATYLQCSNSHVITPEGNSKMKRDVTRIIHKERCILQTQKVQNKSTTLLRTYSTSTQIDATTYVETSDTSLSYVAPTHSPLEYLTFDEHNEHLHYIGQNHSTNYVTKLRQQTTSQNSVNKLHHKTSVNKLHHKTPSTNYVTKLRQQTTSQN